MHRQHNKNGGPDSTSRRQVPIIEEHVAELAASGLSEDTITTAGIYTAEDQAITDLLGWQPKAHSWGRGIVYPYRNVDGRSNGYERVKLDHPRVAHSGKPIKYESPRGMSNRAYFPPGFSRAIQSTDRPIIMTEGEKKSLAVSQLGYAAIGLVGVWGWQEKRKRDDHGRAYGQRRLIRDLQAIEWAERTVVIAFDSDAAVKRSIQVAEARLAEVLTGIGVADVRVARIPSHATDSKKTGLDDFLIAHGDEGPNELRKIIDAAPPAELPDKWGPMETARAIVEDEFMRVGMLAFRWWRDEFYLWTGLRYRKVEKLGKTYSDEMRARFSTPSDETNIITFANGLLDVSNIGGELKIHDHTPRWFSASALAYPFDLTADCPQWSQFLVQVFEGDSERIDLLQRWFGLLLTHDTSYQKLLLMIGPKRSGKGTICRVIQHVIGTDACTAPTLTSLGGDFGLWQLVGKSVALFPDAHVGRSGDAVRIMESIKSIVGEDPQNINRKYLPALMNVRLRVRLVVTCNELMHFHDASGALAARLCILAFQRSFAGDEDRTLENKLRAEASGILNWALDGLNRLRTEGGFNTPAASESVRDNYVRLSAPVSAFLEELCEVGGNNSVKCGDLYKTWLLWAEENGHAQCSDAIFGERLRAAHPAIRRTRPRDGEQRYYAYDGVTLNVEGRHLLNSGRMEKGARS